MAVSLDLAITAIKSGRREEGRQLLNLLIQQNPNDEMAWLWMSGVVETSEQRARCLIHVLAIDPQNQFARKGLAMLGVTVSDSRPVQIPRDSEPIKITKLPPPPPESEIASQKTVPLPDIRAKRAAEPVSVETQPLPVKEKVTAPAKSADKPTEESSAPRKPFLINAQTITDELPFTPLNTPLKAAVQPPIQASPGILNIQIEPVAGFDGADVDEPAKETKPGEAIAIAPTIEPAGVDSTKADERLPATATAPAVAEAVEANPVAEVTAKSDDATAEAAASESIPVALPAEEKAAEAPVTPAPPVQDPILTDTNKLPAIPPSVRAGAVKKAKKRPNPATDTKVRGGLAAATGGGAARPPSKPVVITGIRNGMANPPAPMQLMPGAAAPIPPDPQFSPVYPSGQPMPGAYPALQPGLNPSANDPTRATVPLANPYFVPPAGHANATMSMPMSAAPDYQRPPSQPVPVQGMGMPGMGQPYPPLPQGMALHSNATMMMPPMSEAEARAHLATSHAIPTANAAAMPMQNGFGWSGQYMGYPFPPTQSMEVEEEDDDDESGDINILAVLVFGTLSMTAVGGLGMLILLILTTPTM